MIPAAAHGDRWRTAVRIFIVVLPAQWLGLVIGWQVVARTGVVWDHPWTMNVIPALSGVLAGAGIGRWLTPPAGRRTTMLLVTLGGAVLCWLVLIGLTALEHSTGRPPSVALSLLAGVLMLASCAGTTWWAWWWRESRAAARELASASRAYGSRLDPDA